MRLIAVKRLLLLCLFLITSTVVGQQTDLSEITLGSYGAINEMAWSPDGMWLAVSTDTGIVLYDENLAEISYWESEHYNSHGRLWLVDNNIQWSPDGQLIAMGNGNAPYREYPNQEAYIWNPHTNELLYTLIRPYYTNLIIADWGADSQIVLVLVQVDTTITEIILWDSTTGEEVSHDMEAYNLTESALWDISDDGASISAIHGNTEDTFDSQSGELIASVDISSVVGIPAPAGDRMATLSRRRVTITDAAGNDLEFDLEGINDTSAMQIQWSPTGQYLIVWGAGASPNLMVLDSLTGERLWDLMYSEDGVIQDVVFSPHEDRLVVSVRVGELYMYEFPSGDLIDEQWLSAPYIGISLSPDGTRLAGVSGQSQIVYIWDATTGEELQMLQGRDDPMSLVDYFRSVAWSPDGRYLATGSQLRELIYEGDGEEPIDLFIWDVESGTIIQEVPAVAYRSDYVHEIVWSADSSLIAYTVVGEQYGTSHIGVWDLSTETMLFTRGLEHYSTDIALQPAGDIFAYVAIDISDTERAYYLRFFDIATGEMIVEIPRMDTNYASFIDWRDDEIALTVNAEGQHGVEVWQWQTADDPVHVLDFFSGNGYSRTNIKWQPNGNLLAHNDLDEDANILSLLIWAVKGEEVELRYTFSGTATRYPTRYSMLVTWSQDGTRIATKLTYHAVSILQLP